MPDYKEMYHTLFNETSKAIAILQEAQRQTEEMFVNAPETVVFFENTAVRNVGHDALIVPSPADLTYNTEQSPSPPPACPPSRPS